MPQFGEFDFIIGTPRAVYPGELKWPGSSGYVPGGVFVLPPEQLRRHKIFHVYREAWQARISDDWKGVAASAAPGLATLGSFPPPADKRLASTLHAVLSRLGRCGRKNIDVFSSLSQRDRSIGRRRTAPASSSCRSSAPSCSAILCSCKIAEQRNRAPSHLLSAARRCRVIWSSGGSSVPHFEPFASFS